MGTMARVCVLHANNFHGKGKCHYNSHGPLVDGNNNDTQDEMLKYKIPSSTVIKTGPHNKNSTPEFFSLSVGKLPGMVPIITAEF